MGFRVREKQAALAALVLLAGGLTLIKTAGTADAAASGLFKITCEYSHSAPDDPIVKPNQPGASHLHDFLGNVSTNANSNYASMKGYASTCAHKDTGAYWAPALYQNGKRKINTNGAVVYYTNSVSPGEENIEPFPPNFKMITGDAMNDVEKNVSGHIEWGCLGDTQIGTNGKKPPVHCESDGIQIRITFPSCWDGVDTGGDNSKHMRFPSRGKCPQGYSHALPTVRVNFSYTTGHDVGEITLASGSVFSVHADFWNTWDQPTQNELVNKCLRGKTDCSRFKGTTPGKPAPAFLKTPPVIMPGM